MQVSENEILPLKIRKRSPRGCNSFLCRSISTSLYVVALLPSIGGRLRVLRSKRHITITDKAQTRNLWTITRSVSRGFALRQGFSKVERKAFLRSCELREWNSFTPQMPLFLSSTRATNLCFRSVV